MTDAPLDRAAYKRQLRGWLSYAFASEVFVVVSLTLFLPICLEQFARDNGFLLPDRTVPCSSIAAATAEPDADKPRCVVKLGWVWIDSASFSLYVYSISVALQALTVISMGGIADHPAHRKRLLLAFAFTGSAAAALFLLLPSHSPLWPAAALLAIAANVCFGASVVAMNAYLPGLARGADEVVAVLADVRAAPSAASAPADDHADVEDASAPLLASSAEEGALALSADGQLRYAAALSGATARISAQGIALGYAAGIALLLLALVPVTLLHGSTFALRCAIGASGVWWALGSVPAAMWLPGGEGVKVREDGDGEGEGEWSGWREVGRAWRRLGGMVRWGEVRRLRNTFKYLAAWFLLSDGFTTITSTAILFGKTSLNMPASSLVLVGVLTPTAGILGALVWPRLQRSLGWSSLRILVTLVGLASVIPAYGCLGFLPVFAEGRVKFGGLTTPGEMYVLAVYFGSVYGAFQSYARALYAEMIPPGEEARWYGLFSITDKSSSFIGPLVVGLIADTTGNIRYAFFFLVIMVWAAIPILGSVDVHRGREDAKRYVYR